MANLTWSDKRKLERLFRMHGGYVLDFSNRTFSEFIDEHAGRDIYDARYEQGSGSKAHRLRAFWTIENDAMVAKVIAALIAHGHEREDFKDRGPLLDECQRIVTRLQQGGTVTELDALVAEPDARDFDIVAKQVREAIDKNQPEAGIDRLHTFVVKFIRTLCEEQGIPAPRDKPLHSLFGEYVKRLRAGNHLESEMTVRILKSSISVLEAFNDVRNNQSLAHDNPVLNYDESLLIFNHVASSVRFLRSLQQRIRNIAAPQDDADDDIPF